jgi:hypothetical protein
MTLSGPRPWSPLKKQAEKSTVLQVLGRDRASNLSASAILGVVWFRPVQSLMFHCPEVV